MMQRSDMRSTRSRRASRIPVNAALFFALATSASFSTAQAQQGGPRSVIPWLQEGAGAETGGGAIASTPAQGGAAPAQGGAGAVASNQGGGVTRPAAPSGDATSASLPPRIDLSVGADLDDNPGRPKRTANVGSARNPAKVEEVSVSGVSASAAGVISAREIGLTVDAWAESTEARARALIAAVKPSRLRTANQLAIRLVGASLKPPVFAAGETPPPGPDFLDLRVQALLRLGAAEQAAVLVETAGRARLSATPEASLLSGRDLQLCRALLTPDAEPTLTRIYCFILAGDAQGARLALDASRALGETDEMTLSLLDGLAEPALRQYATPPKTVEELTPLRLATLRYLNAPPPEAFSETASLELLASTRVAKTPPKDAIVALERLEMVGAVETKELRAAYQQIDTANAGKAAERIDAVRKALAATYVERPAFAKEAFEQFKPGAASGQIARLLGPSLAKDAETAIASGVVVGWTPQMRDALRISGHPDLASALFRRAAEQGGVDPRENLRDWLARGEFKRGWRVRWTEPLVVSAAAGDREAGLMLAALDALGAPIADTEMFPKEEAFAFTKPGQAAEIAFEAIVILSAEEKLTPKALHGALSRLVKLGLREFAQRIAIEAVLLAD